MILNFGNVARTCLSFFELEIQTEKQGSAESCLITRKREMREMQGGVFNTAADLNVR